MAKELIKGNQAIAQAAINAGCQCYFGYPITPQSEISEYLATKMIDAERVFIPCESELAAINMVIGAGSTGTKAMTSSSSCGIALMQEAISAMACAEIPGVIVSVMRAGPGLGDITPSQADYFQAVYGGGNGDYKTIVLAPSTVQEAIDLTYRSFYLSQKYRNPVMLLADGMLGQMMEPVEFKQYDYPLVDVSSWSLSGAKERAPRKLVTLHMGGDVLENLNKKLFEKYRALEKNETDYETYMTEDAEIVLTAFGTVARVAKAAVNKAREAGIKVGLFRPITLYPFAYDALYELSKGKKAVLDIELNMGQMLKDVKIAVKANAPVEFLGHVGGRIMTESEILTKITEISSAGRELLV